MRWRERRWPTPASRAPLRSSSRSRCASAPDQPVVDWCRRAAHLLANVRGRARIRHIPQDEL